MFYSSTMLTVEEVPLSVILYMNINWKESNAKQKQIKTGYFWQLSKEKKVALETAKAATIFHFNLWDNELGC